MDLRLFSLIVMESARDLVRDNEAASFDDLFRTYNERVTPLEALTPSGFRLYLRKAFEADHLHLNIPKDSSRTFKADLEYPSGRPKTVKDLITRHNRHLPRIAALRKELGTDFLDGANTHLLDAMLRNQIYLFRLSGTIKRDTEALLDATARDIREKVAAKLKKARARGAPTPAELEWLERYIRSVRMGGWEQISTNWVREMAALAKTETRNFAGVINVISPTTLVLAIPDARALSRIATSNPFEGRTLREWARAQADADVTRILNQVRIGMLQGETIPQMTARLNGVADLTKRQASAIVRTAVNFIGNEARDAFISENAELFSGERFVATLDARTTAVCRGHDGKQFPVGQGPKPPLHFNCRSLRVPTLNGEALGQRPAKPHTERQLLRDFAAENDLDVPRTRNGLPHGFKGAFDKWARQRIRDLTARVPSATSYQSWLERQSRAFQDDVLGPTRAKLFRSGKLTLDKFVDTAGNELTLAQLARRHADAFRAAGLDPEDFL